MRHARCTSRVAGFPVRHLVRPGTGRTGPGHRATRGPCPARAGPVRAATGPPRPGPRCAKTVLRPGHGRGQPAENVGHSRQTACRTVKRGRDHDAYQQVPRAACMGNASSRQAGTGRRGRGLTMKLLKHEVERLDRRGTPQGPRRLLRRHAGPGGSAGGPGRRPGGAAAGGHRHRGPAFRQRRRQWRPDERGPAATGCRTST